MTDGTLQHRLSRSTLGIAGALALLGLAAAPALAADSATATFLDRAGTAIGTAEIVEAPGGVVITIEIEGLPAGVHALHVHGAGHCEDHEAGFKASMGHINPDDRMHGLLNPEGPDAGDLPNVHVQEDGQAAAEFYSTRLSIDGADGRAAILDADGAALVMHEGPDDYTTQPIGGAGARIACAVIEAN